MNREQTAIAVSGHLQKQAWADGLMPPVEQVAPGLWSIPVPIPDNPLRYVLVYAFDVGDGAVIVDAGWPTDDAWEALTAGLATAGFDVRDVKAVLVTHIHPDHYGLASRVREASGAWVGMHPADAAILETRYETVEELLAAGEHLLAESGVPESERPTLSEASMGIRHLMTVAKPDVLLDDGFEPPVPGWTLRTLWTPGHSPGHVCFYEPDRRLLLSGDHVLPRISPNISLHPQQPQNPLADFLDALARVGALDVDEVLPAHEYRFRGIRARADELIGHHEARLAEIEDLLRASPGRTTWELTLSLTWSRPWDDIPTYMRRAANGETLAHLTLLESQHRVRREGTTPVHWWPAQA